MILYHNLHFFDKYGKSLNLEKREYINAIVNRNNDLVVDAVDARLEIITNAYGVIEFVNVKVAGTGYDENLTILIQDTETGTSYLIDSIDFIELGSNGEILSVTLPSLQSGFCYPSITYSGEMFFPKISVGLVETAQVYILEEMISNEETVYSSPKTYSDKTDIITEELKIVENTGDAEISLFSVDYNSDEHPFIEILTKDTTILNDGLSDSIQNGIRVTELTKSNTILYNILVKSDKEGIFEKQLDICEEVSGNQYIFASIKLRAEIEDEDERLKLMLDNFGIQMNLQELKIFRDTDINEELPNYLLLNSKRKEMLLEYHNIFPYIGSYKALVNIINFFGYGDTRLKEYWLNVDKTRKLKKSKTSSYFNTNKLPIDLTSLHSFGNAFKPIPIIKQQSNVESTDDSYVPSFGENNSDFETDALNGLSLSHKSYPGKGIVGKKVNNTGQAKAPAVNEKFKQDVNSLSTIAAIKQVADQPLPEEVINSIHEQQFRQIEIPMQLSQKGKHWQTEEMLPNKIWKKTNLFGLFYDITRETGEYDIYGMPITEDAFVFSEDEMLVKLFSLREYLKEKFMPINARIIDIVGEGIYFDRWAINIWKDDVLAHDVTKNEVVDFSIDSGVDSLITDLQDYGQSKSLPTSDTSLTDLTNVFLNNFSNGISFKNENGPVGCKTNLSLTEFIITWDEMQCAWDSMINITWDNAAYKEYYEIEWIVNHETPNKFTYNIRGLINTYKDIELIFPYEGNYNITCILYDLSNHSVRKTKVLNVKMPNADFVCFGRSINPVTTWDSCKNLTWDDLVSEWRNPAISNSVTWDDLDGITWDDLDIKKYEDQTDVFKKSTKWNIKKISESDRYVGNLVSINTSTKTLVCEGQFITPKLRNAVNNIPLDYVYLRYADTIFKTGVISATYSNEQTILVLQSLPTGLTIKWDCLREIGQTIIVESNGSDFNPPAVGEYILLSNEDSSVNQISITDVINDGTSTVGFVINSQISKKSSEFGRVYKKKTLLSGTDFITIDSDYSSSKTIQLNYIASELIPGFSILTFTYTLNSEILSLNVLLEHMNDNNTGSLLNVIELDGDMSMLVNASNISISYEYWSFNVKLRHYIDNELNNEIFCNFNDYPYTNNFINENNDLNGDWYFDYGNRYGELSLEIINTGYEDNNLILYVNDLHSELYLVSSQYKASWITFDEDYALTRYGTDIFNWNNLHDVKWDDCSHLTWNMLEYKKAPLCNFKINSIAPNGRIQFNELPFFEFRTLVGTMSNIDMFTAAVNELNNTDNVGLGRFHYQLIDNNGTYTIHAIAKNEGKYYLGYLIFDRGVTGEYDNPNYSHSYPVGNWYTWNTPYTYGPDNKFAIWNPVARAYYEFGFNYAGKKGWYPAEIYKNGERVVYESTKNAYLNPDYDFDNALYTQFPSLKSSVKWRMDEGYKLLYDYALTSPFTWNDIIGSHTSIEIKKLTTLFFISANSKVAGKSQHEWTLKENGANLNECVVTKDYLIWTFTKAGVYDLTLEITDINGNNSIITKNAFIKVS